MINFLKGLAALFGHKDDHGDIINKSVGEAILEDWQEVGKDMEHVLWEHKNLSPSWKRKPMVGDGDCLENS